MPTAWPNNLRHRCVSFIRLFGVCTFERVLRWARLGPTYHIRSYSVTMQSFWQVSMRTHQYGIFIKGTFHDENVLSHVLLYTYFEFRFGFSRRSQRLEAGGLKQVSLSPTFYISRTLKVQISSQKNVFISVFVLHNFRRITGGLWGIRLQNWQTCLHGSADRKTRKTCLRYKIMNLWDFAMISTIFLFFASIRH